MASRGFHRNGSVQANITRYPALFNNHSDSRLSPSHSSQRLAPSRSQSYNELGATCQPESSIQRLIFYDPFKPDAQLGTFAPSGLYENAQYYAEPEAISGSESGAYTYASYSPLTSHSPPHALTQSGLDEASPSPPPLHQTQPRTDHTLTTMMHTFPINTETEIVDPVERRRASNRASQRAFRDRKEKHRKALEGKLQQYHYQYESLRRSYSQQCENVMHLTAQIDQLTTEIESMKQCDFTFTSPGSTSPESTYWGSSE